MCKHWKYTKEHTFIKCPALTQERKKNARQIRSLFPWYAFNSIAFCLFGINRNIITYSPKLDTMYTHDQNFPWVHSKDMVKTWKNKNYLNSYVLI